MIRSARELIKLGENTIVIFTKGDLLNHDQYGAGSTGNWRADAKKLDGLKKVIIYLRGDEVDDNRIFMGEYDDWKKSPEENRKIIYFSTLREMGKTTSNWVDFGGTRGLAFFYLP